MKPVMNYMVPTVIEQTHRGERGWDIFNRHLSRVVDICRRSGLAPMIWSAPS